ncbi:FAST kinase domain-containing protein 2, mitochondrial [Elgaria multicarinata webbii]|uniref:FAST kinase domain-containing protein 2, mitochondrial n=1 Tax=Elgaria multicarinata webbii TaxID=159646 RepID=UPI002FCCE746
MNRKWNCFIGTMKWLQACHYAPSPISRTTMQMFALGMNGHTSAVESIYLRQFLQYVSPRRFQSSVRFFSEDTLTINVEGANANEQKTTHSLLEHVQVPEPLPVKPTQPPSGFSVSPKEVRSAIEDMDGRSTSQLFFDDLRKCVSPCDVLDLVAKCPVSLKYVSNCLSTMWVLFKKFSEDQKHYERRLMLEHPQFSQLCQCLMNEAKYMWRDDLAYSMLAVVKLGVPQNTRVVQTLLRVCQERLNEFDDRSLSVIAATLQVMEKCKNVEALQVGLQLLVEQRVPKITDIFMLQTMMKCIGKDAPLMLKTKLEKKILSQMDHFTQPNAHHMFSVLAEMNHRSIPILNSCSNKLIENIEGIPFWRLLSVLRSCKDLMYYNTTLYSTIADYAASTFYMWDTKQVILFVSAFENLGFRPVDLMDKLGRKVISCPESLNMKDLMYVLRSYCHLNHIPGGQNQEFLEALNSVLNKYLPSISKVNLLKAVYSFCILGYLPQPALNQLLQDEILHDVVTSDGQNIEQNEMMLRTINVCLALDGNSFIKSASLPVEKLPPASAFNFPDVQEVLLTLLGDGSLFQPNVQVTHGYNIDFKILMDANRRTVMSDTEANQLADDSKIQRIAVLCVPGSAFCIDSSHPRGRLAMKMRHLHLQGYHVIPVNYQKFQKLKKEEALDFLKGEIFSADAHPDSD